MAGGGKVSEIDAAMERIGAKGMGAERIQFEVLIPSNVQMRQVYGDDGLLYWAKDWGEPWLNADGEFALRVVAKDEYCRSLLERLHESGGRVK